MLPIYYAALCGRTVCRTQAVFRIEQPVLAAFVAILSPLIVQARDHELNGCRLLIRAAAVLACFAQLCADLDE
jgi:hypothetical protein